LLQTHNYKIIKNYNLERPELAIICEKSLRRVPEPVENQYRSIKPYISAYNKPELTKKELLAEKLVGIVPVSIYTLVKKILTRL
jgi:hypothetical protein